MMRNKKRAISNFFILLVLVAGISWVCGKFIHLGSVEYTDNAQVKQHLTPVSTRVQGFIKKICFEEYQTVKKRRYPGHHRRYGIPSESGTGRSRLSQCTGRKECHAYHYQHHTEQHPRNGCSH